MNKKTDNNHQLLHEMRKGSTVAFEMIFRAYWKELYAIAMSKLLSHDDAEEVIQIVFTGLWEKRKTLLINDVGPYLRAAVKNRILNHIRDNITKETNWNHYGKFIPNEAECTADDVAFEQLNAAVEEAVNELPEKSRQVFRLSRMEGKSNAEIADLLELSEKSIEYHLTKSLRTLRVRLRHHI